MPPEAPVTRILLMLQVLRSRGRLAHPYNPVWNLWTIPRRTGLVDHRAVGSDSIVERTSGTVEVFARQVIHKEGPQCCQVSTHSILLMSHKDCSRSSLEFRERGCRRLVQPCSGSPAHTDSTGRSLTGP